MEKPKKPGKSQRNIRAFAGIIRINVGQVRMLVLKIQRQERNLKISVNKILINANLLQMLHQVSLMANMAGVTMEVVMLILQQRAPGMDVLGQTTAASAQMLLLAAG